MSPAGAHGRSDRGEGRSDLAYELLALGGQSDATRGAVEQANPETRFQRRHRVTQRRGRHVKFACRNSEATVSPMTPDPRIATDGRVRVSRN